jgi:hypothetical protein
MKASFIPNLTRLAIRDRRILGGLAAGAICLLASCTTSRPVSYAGPEAVKTIPAQHSVLVGAAKDGGEVELGYQIRTQMECWRCLGASWIWYDTDYYTDYTCPHCSSINTL